MKKIIIFATTNFKNLKNIKKIILTLAVVFAVTFANAQDKKEGSAGFAKGDL